MANIMDSFKPKNHVHRDGFDLSHKNCFTAKAGELLPVFSREVIPGDKFQINLSSLTRTMPVASAAYTRLREYFDFYFVPDRLLWRYSDMFFTQMDNSNIAKGPSSSATTFEHCPYISSSLVLSAISELNTRSSSILPTWTSYSNLIGFNRYNSICKLLSYLDYGLPADFSTYQKQALGEKSKAYSGLPLANRPYNLFKLLAYQKIYNDFYRFEQWEKQRPYLYNVDYLNTSTPVFGTDHLKQLDWRSSDGTFFDLRYANYHKDNFLGVLPTSQFGESAVAAPIKGDTMANLYQQDGTLYYMKSLPNSSLLPSNSSPMGIDIVSIRMAEFLQKYKEIAVAADPDYKSQLEAHWNTHISNDRSDLCQYLGGIANNVDISEVVNTNLEGLGYLPDVAGKGIGAANGHVKFTAREHGVLMCIYHVLPLLDYQDLACDKFNTKIFPTDFAIPEFDSVGMEQVPFYDMISRDSLDPLDEAGDEDELHVANQAILGYAPRYIDYKTAVDKIHGAFGNSLYYWVSPMTSRYFQQLYYQLSAVNHSWAIDYSFFKVRPQFLDSIFANAVGSDTSSDQFLINTFFDVKAVRNLDRNGLPY